MARKRPFALLIALLAGLALALAACGGSDEEAAATEDPADVLARAVTSGEKVTSATLDARLKLVAKGASSGDAPIEATIKGPIVTREQFQLPLLQLQATVSGAGLDLQAGATATEDKGYLSFRGTDYEVPADVFAQFQQGWKEAREKASKEAKGEVTFESLGIDPRKWMRNLENAGASKVGDDPTVKITGDVDAGAFLDQLQTILERVQEIAPQSGTEVPQLSAKERAAFAEAVPRFVAEIHVGTEDDTIRRVKFDLTVRSEAAAKASGSQATAADVTLDVALLDLNEELEITAPTETKPFSELTAQLQQLGALGGALGSGSGSGSGSSGSGVSNEALEKYSACIRKAGDDTAAARECADLLTP